MKGFVELRKQKSEILEALATAQQPSVWMDAKRVPQCVDQRGLFWAALTETCKTIMGVFHEIPTWIGSKMSPILQLTCNTDASPMTATCGKVKGVVRATRHIDRLRGGGLRAWCVAVKRSSRLPKQGMVLWWR